MDSAAFTVLFLAALLCNIFPVKGSIWNWVISNPFNSENFDDLDNHPRNTHRLVTTSNTIIESTTRRIEPCRTDKGCGRGRFCDRHYGFCHLHRVAGETCRRDGHCMRGFDCMFGKCKKRKQLKTEGARCKHDRDCNNTMCCAKQHGEHICKKRIKLYHKCYVPKGGLDYTLNELCPCEQGLICKDVGTIRNDDLEWRFWSTLDRMRCAAP
ncbi:unnamed protein product [Owenia fusiformis]|uniref:Uncharacterized protein n=1 Tax=Owenia fusiformis TaxID=6347 RepID=A0A8J1UUD0_OWEFU|nr:unnamed protein product [Owenia fusiformis]